MPHMLPCPCMCAPSRCPPLPSHACTHVLPEPISPRAPVHRSSSRGALGDGLLGQRVTGAARASHDACCDARCGSRATRSLAAVTSLAEDRAPWTNLFSMAVSGRVSANIRTRVFWGLKLLLQEQRVFLCSWMSLRAFFGAGGAQPLEPARLAPGALRLPS